MKPPSYYTIGIYAFSAVVIVLAYYIIWQRDERIVGHDAPYRSTMDTAAMYFSGSEIQTSNTFSDSTLPALQQLGLIVTFEPREWETLIIVSGPMWRERSDFFKEGFLHHMSIHNKIRGRPSAVRIMDTLSGKLLAQITVSERKEIYE